MKLVCQWSLNPDSIAAKSHGNSPAPSKEGKENTVGCVGEMIWKPAPKQRKALKCLLSDQKR